MSSKKLKIILLIVACLLLIVFCVLYYNYHENKSEVVFFDVGQGDSALINLPGNNEILIDGGPDMTVLYKLGKYLPVYNRDIELMILTHPHSDHVTGLIEVLNRYNVKQVMYTGVKYESGIYQQFIKTLKHKNIKTLALEDINLNNNILKIIYPWQDISGVEFKDINDSSIVVKLDTPNKDFLFTGDIGIDIEKEIVETRHRNLSSGQMRASLQAHILKVSHQGSDTSSGEEFLEAVNPEWAVISVGENNFGHPSLRTIRRLERLGAEVLRTDEKGDIIFGMKNE